MFSRSSTILVLSLIFVMLVPQLRAQEEDHTIRLESLGDKKIPKSLLNLVSVDLDDVPLEEALSVISTKGGLALNYNRSRIPVSQKVSVAVENARAVEALMAVLASTRTELLITPEGQLAVVPARAAAAGIVSGRVIDGLSGEPLPGTNISVVGTYRGTTSDNEGRFSLEGLDEGTHTLRFRFIGYAEKDVQTTISDAPARDLLVELEIKPVLLKEITVSPSQFAIMGSNPIVRKSLTKENIETITWGEDIYRAVVRLPGIASSDYSARFTVRGGEHDQVLVLLDGLELYEPFHMKEVEGGGLSIVDVEAIDGIDLMTGGFGAEYGNRMSGVFNIKSRRPTPGRSRTSMGISLMNARLMTEGTFGNGKGSWFFSARRGYVDIVLDLMQTENQPDPTYYDVLGKVEYAIGKNHTLSAHVLHAGDRVEFTEDDDDYLRSRYDNTYGWMNWKAFLSSRLFAQTVAHFGRVSHSRSGTAYLGDSGEIDFIVDDIKSMDVFGLKQDWTIDWNDFWFLKGGWEYKALYADYDYSSTKTRFSQEGSRWQNRIERELSPSGHHVTAYVSNRFRLLPPLTAEVGLRYDRASYAGDDLISPRINAVLALGEHTYLRGGWGHFRQSQGIHEIRVEQGENDFLNAESAEHWVAGFEHLFGNGIHFRMEVYRKNLSDLWPDYRNWSNSIEFYPELQDDRYTLNLVGGRSEGVEVYFKYDRGGRWTWWASYAWASAEEQSRSLIANGVEYTMGAGFYPARVDQRHTIYLDANYRPNRKWHLHFAWQYHTGWPYTELVLFPVNGNDGSDGYYAAYDGFLGSRYPAYHRLDIRLNRHFYTARGRISAFISLINLYNRGNVRNYYYEWTWDESGIPWLDREEEYWFRLLPSVGVSWSWFH